MSRIHFITSHPTFLKGLLFSLKSQNFEALHTIRIHRYFCHFHLLWANPITFTQDFFQIILCIERYLEKRGNWDLVFSMYQRLREAVERKRYFSCVSRYAQQNTKASIHVEAYRREFPNLAFMLWGH